MVNSIRIKEYVFPVASGLSVGSYYGVYSEHSLNGEILKVTTFSNFTGSLAIKQSGLNTLFLDGTITSGTAKYESFSFTNNTGSFVINSPIMLTISGVPSGTAVRLGPVSVLYR